MSMSPLSAGQHGNTSAKRIRAGYSPGLCAKEVEWDTRLFHAHGKSVEVTLPRLTPAQLQAVARCVRAAAREHLAPMPVMEVVDVIDRVIARMLDIHNPARREMEALLPVVTGFDAEMTRLGMNASL